MFTDFREKGRQREGETSMGERNMDRLPPLHAPTRDRTHSLRTCPDRKAKLKPLGVGDVTPINWATQPGLILVFNYSLCTILFCISFRSIVLIFLR